jgi:hypothetical protein
VVPDLNDNPFDDAGNAKLVIETDLKDASMPHSGGDEFSSVGGGLVSKSSQSFNVNMEQSYEEFETNTVSANYDLKGSIIKKVKIVASTENNHLNKKVSIKY